MLNHGVLYLVGLHGYSIKLRKKKNLLLLLKIFVRFFLVLDIEQETGYITFHE